MQAARNAFRTTLCRISRHLPRLRGLGRCILLADRFLTDTHDPASYEVVATINGSCRLTVDTRVLEQKFAYYYGEWEKPLLDAVLRHYSPGAFYDVGGSIGLYAVAVGDRCRRQGGYVRTIEPLPINLDRLQQNLQLNGLNESIVKVHPLGLSDRPGSFRIALAASGIPGNAKVVSNGGVEVAVITLDHLWEQCGRETVGFVKIDTEGYDAPILMGGQQLLRHCRPNLLVEFNRERMRNLKFDMSVPWQLLVEELGYRPFRIDSRGNEHPLEHPAEHENILFLSR